MDLLKRSVAALLTLLARIVLRRYKPRVIAIVGSMGKTTTRDAVFAVLSPHLYVRKSERGYSGAIGVALTVLGCTAYSRDPFKWLRNIVHGIGLILVTQKYPAWLVIEIGADRPGDIKGLARWLRPDVAVLTGVPDVPVHVEFFDSPEALIEEKASVAKYLRPGGKLVLNWDSEHTRGVRTEHRGATLTYGIQTGSDYQASGATITYGETGKPVGVDFRVNRNGASLPISTLGALGAQRIYASLAALAVAEVCGVDLVAAGDVLRSWETLPGRMRLLEGKNGAVLIDDTYNSSPSPALAALDTLHEVTTNGRRIAVLGDMLELGKYSADAHRQVGAHAAAAANILITVGFRARAMAQAALDAGMPEANIRQYEHTEAARAGKELALELQEGDVVVIKGSQAMRLERTVEALLANPLKAPELLVRQEDEWKNQ